MVNDIEIRYFEKKDINQKIEWINNPRINEFLHYSLPLSYDRTLNWYNKIINQQNREDFIYELVEEGVKKSIGLIGLINIDKINRKAEFYIINGETKYQGRGIASKATKKYLEHVFNKYNLNKVYLFTEEENFKARKLFESVGFKKEGVLKDDIIYRSRKINRVQYAIFRDDFCES